MKDVSGKPEGPYLIDLPQAAARKLPRFVCDFIDGGAEGEAAIARNRAAFDRAVVTPRIGRQAQSACGADLFGERYAAPFGIAPIGLADLVAPKADLALARAAKAANIPYITSAAASTDVATLAQATGRVPWFQLYMPRDPAVSEAMLKHVADIGVSVLVVTLDVPIPGRRLRDLRNGLTLPLRPSSRLFWQMLSRPGWLIARLLAGPIGFPNFARHVDLQGRNSFAAIMREQAGGAQDWAALRGLRQRWKGTLVLKGILAPEDASQAKDMGADALIVSNHGGRQFDAAPASLDALAAVRNAAPGLPIMLDSGVRSGTDIVRAVAAGADFAFVGRPFLQALGALGTDGPTVLARQLVRDAQDALTLAGYASWEELRNAHTSGQVPCRRP
jgi:isopentenyl diphosphate isomerase/L-lactate dehydrogenase-like FMN-dependent dehydrogenase